MRVVLIILALLLPASVLAQTNAYGPGISSDATGRPFSWQPLPGYGPADPLSPVSPDVYGPGILIEPDMQISRIRLVWGCLCQGEYHAIFVVLCHVIPFFCSTRAASVPPSRPHVSIAVARSGSQGQRFFSAAGREHGGRLPAIGWLAAR
jgi:hypothetical protein